MGVSKKNVFVMVKAGIVVGVLMVMTAGTVYAVAGLSSEVAFFLGVLGGTLVAMSSAVGIAMPEEVQAEQGRS